MSGLLRVFYVPSKRLALTPRWGGAMAGRVGSAGRGLHAREPRRAAIACRAERASLTRPRAYQASTCRS
jgi:hypothetical protein